MAALTPVFLHCKWSFLDTRGCFQTEVYDAKKIFAGLKTFFIRSHFGFQMVLVPIHPEFQSNN